MGKSTSVNGKINKEYFECYAKYSLQISLDKKYRRLKKGESPDWQSRRMDIGVEVTRAIDKDIYLAYNIIHEYFGDVFTSKHVAAQIAKRDNQCEENDEAYADCSDISNINNLKRRYIHKTIKLNKNYKQYSQNYLYMFTFKSMDKNEVIQCLDIDLTSYKVNFDIYFVNCFDRLYICDFVNREIIEGIAETPEALGLIKKKALRKSGLPTM